MARVVLNDSELKTLLDSPDGATGQYLVRKSQQVLNKARSLCPVDTGNLRGSLTYEVTRTGVGGKLGARVGTNVPYAIYVHEGTKYQKGQPFLEDALASVQL